MAGMTPVYQPFLRHLHLIRFKLMIMRNLMHFLASKGRCPDHIYLTILQLGSWCSDIRNLWSVKKMYCTGLGWLKQRYVSFMVHAFWKRGLCCFAFNLETSCCSCFCLNFIVNEFLCQCFRLSLLFIGGIEKLIVWIRFGWNFLWQLWDIWATHFYDFRSGADQVRSGWILEGLKYQRLWNRVNLLISQKSIRICCRAKH